MCYQFLKRPRVLIIAVLSVQWLGILSTSGQQLNVRLLAQTSDNKPLCALDSPSTSVTLTAEIGLEAVPPTVRCAMKCASVKCRQFNYITGETQTCQLYNALPTHFGFQPNCLHFMLPDIDECVVNNGGCHELATCNNTLGSYTCTCKPGYAGNGIYCSDIDECAVNRGGCSADATCTNTLGGYKCTCTVGLTGDGVTCYAICPDNFLYVAAVPGCYRLVLENSPGANVSERCQQLQPNSHAVVITSSTEQTSIGNIVNGCAAAFDNSGKSVWTAAQHQTQTPSLWQWMTPQFELPLNFTAWGAGQPDDYGGIEGCIQLVEIFQYEWNDGSCETPLCFVCEFDL